MFNRFYSASGKMINLHRNIETFVSSDDIINDLKELNRLSQQSSLSSKEEEDYNSIQKIVDDDLGFHINMKKTPPTQSTTNSPNTNSIANPKSTINLSSLPPITNAYYINNMFGFNQPNPTADVDIVGTLKLEGHFNNYIDNTTLSDEDIPPSYYIAAKQGQGIYNEMRMVSFEHGYPEIVKKPKGELCSVETLVVSTDATTSQIKQTIYANNSIWYRTSNINPKAYPPTDNWNMGSRLNNDNGNGPNTIPSLDDITITTTLGTTQTTSTFNEDYLFLILWNNNNGIADPDAMALGKAVSTYWKNIGRNPANIRYLTGTENIHSIGSLISPDNRTASIDLIIPPGKFVVSYSGTKPPVIINNLSNQIITKTIKGVDALFLGNSKYILLLDTTLTTGNIALNVHSEPGGQLNSKVVASYNIDILDNMIQTDRFTSPDYYLKLGKGEYKEMRMIEISNNVPQIVTNGTSFGILHTIVFASDYNKGPIIQFLYSGSLSWQREGINTKWNVFKQLTSNVVRESKSATDDTPTTLVLTVAQQQQLLSSIDAQQKQITDLQTQLKTFENTAQQLMSQYTQKIQQPVQQLQPIQPIQPI